jgi:hypothetical protein
MFTGGAEPLPYSPILHESCKCCIIWNTYLAKYDSSGNHLLSKAYGLGTAHVQVADAAQGSEMSSFIAGRLNGTIHLGDDEISSGDSSVLFVHKFMTP